MATSQATYDPAINDYYKKRPKVYPPKPTIPNRKGKNKEFDLKYHADVLMKYSKAMPKRAPSALDLRKSISDLPNYTNTVKYGGILVNN